jgi:hypothetical protein
VTKEVPDRVRRDAHILGVAILAWGTIANRKAQVPEVPLARLSR